MISTALNNVSRPSITALLTIYIYSNQTFRVASLEHLIIESVDSISRDGPDTPIYVIQHKNLKNSAQVRF